MKSEAGYLPGKLPLMLSDSLLPRETSRDKKGSDFRATKGQEAKETWMHRCLLNF